MPDISLNVDLKVQQALAELKRLSPGADKEAKAIAASLGKALKNIEKDAKKVGDTMGMSGSKALKAFGPFGGVLAKISPEAGSAASAIAGMTSAVEGFGAANLGALGVAGGAAVAALTVAVGAGYVAWRIYSEEAARSAEIAERVGKAEAALAPLLVAARDAALEAAVATGKITEAAAKLEKDGAHSVRAFESATAGARDRMQELEAASTGMTAAHGLRMLADSAENLSNSPLFAGFKAPLAAIDAFTTSSTEAVVEFGKLGVVVGRAGVAVTEKAAADTAAADAAAKAAAAAQAAAAATARHAAAAREAKSALDALNAEMERAESAAEANAKGYNAAIASLQGMEDASRHTMAGEMDRLNLDRQAALAKSQALADEASTYASTVSARETIDAQHRATDIAAEAEYQAAVSALQAKADAERATMEAAASAQRVQEQQQVGSAIVSLGDSVLAATTRQYDTTTREGRRAALSQFYAQKAVMLGQATIAGALAVQQALASAAPPVNYVLAAATGAAAAVEIGTIAATQPSFHRGYAPDEQQARVLKRESVLTTAATAAVGADKVGALNAGVTGGGYQGPAPIIVGHRVFDTLIKRELASSGALSAALTARQIPGHRTNRRGTTG